MIKVEEVKNAITGNGDIEFKIQYETKGKMAEASKKITKEGVEEAGEKPVVSISKKIE